MQLKQIEQKLVNLLGYGNSYFARCFLFRDGRFAAFVHEHNHILKSIGSSLDKYIAAGGCRLYITENNDIAIDTGQKLTDKQIQTIIKFIRENRFAYLIYAQLKPKREFGITDFMQIKPYMFLNALKSKKKYFQIKNF